MITIVPISGINDSCETDTGCRDLKYTYCSEDNRCTCIENYTILNGYCLGLIDANCSDDSDCAIDNSICDDSDTCQCSIDSYLSVDEDKCHPYAKRKCLCLVKNVYKDLIIYQSYPLLNSRSA